MSNQGILLAGGIGTRLGPLTKSVNKHLLPIFDKPMIFYSLSTLLLAGVRNVVLVTSPENIEAFSNLLGDGSSWGIKINYAAQLNPDGIPQAFALSEPFLDKNKSIFLALGDNILYGVGTGRKLAIDITNSQAEINCYFVSNPENYGIVEIDSQGKVLSLEEKPTNPKSNLAIVGFYLFPFDAIERSRNLRKSPRGEYEIIDLLKYYSQEGKLQVNLLPRGTTWLDAGSEDGLLQSAEFVSVLQKRQGILVNSPDEIAWQMGYISDEQLILNYQAYGKSRYAEMLINIMPKKKNV